MCFESRMTFSGETTKTKLALRSIMLLRGTKPKKVLASFRERQKYPESCFFLRSLRMTTLSGEMTK